MIFQLWQFYIIILFEGPTLSTGYIPNCEALEPVKYCPPYDSSQWKSRAYCKNCKADQKYHCCKDYDSPKLDCPQGDVYCKDEFYVEGCAEEKFCKIGEEPVLSFIKNQVRVEKPEVFCVLCYNNNRYNHNQNKSSATYSECPEVKRNICTHDTHKIECLESSSEISDRFCRCDSKNGYFPISDPDDHPTDGCSYNNYDCKIGRCGPSERMLLNYTCECEDGFYKHNNSMSKCAPLHTSRTASVRMPSSTFTTTTSQFTRTKHQTTVLVSSANVSVTQPSSQDGGSSTVLIVCAVVSTLVLISTVIFVVRVVRACKRSNAAAEDTNNSLLTHLTTIEAIESHGEEESSVTSENVPENVPFISPNQNSNSTLNLSKYEKGSQATLRSVNENVDALPKHLFNDVNRSPQSFATNSLDRPRHSKAFRIEPKDIENCFDIEEYRVFVRRVLQTSRSDMINCLNPVLVLDKLEENDVFDQSVLQDIKDENKTTDKTRQILDRVKTNYKCYKAFKNSLKDTKQNECLEKLEMQERILYKEITAARKEKKPLVSGADLSENEQLTKTNESHLQSRRHTYSTSSTGFDFENDDDSPPQNKVLYENESEKFDATSVDNSNKNDGHDVNIYESRLDPEPGDDQKDGQTDQESDGTSEE